MIKHFSDNSVLKEHILYFYKSFFGIMDLIEFGINVDSVYEIFSSFCNDPDFFVLKNVDNINNVRIISFRNLVSPFIELNLRQNGTFNCNISYLQLKSYFRMKYGLTLNNKDFPYIINTLMRFGLVSPCANGFTLPINNLLRYIKRFNYEIEMDILKNRIISINKDNNHDCLFHNENLNLNINKIIKTLTPKEGGILALRHGLFGSKLHTLEEIGSKYNLTRERIRQILMLSFRKLRHPKRIEKFKKIYYELLTENQGSIILNTDIYLKVLNPIAFIYDLLGVSYIKKNYGLIIDGKCVPSHFFNKSMLWKKRIKFKNIINEVKKRNFHWLCWKDLMFFYNKLNSLHEIKQNKIHRIYCTMKEIGKPAHYRTIAERYNEIYPIYSNTEHNIHAGLTIYPNYFVWTGVFGVYALNEWGYQRPKLSLHETCYKIVKEQYEKTGKPVNFSYVEEKIFEYRKIVNPTSIVFSCYLNPGIKVLDNKTLVPAKVEDWIQVDNEEEIAQLTNEEHEELERKLREFESFLIFSKG